MKQRHGYPPRLPVAPSGQPASKPAMNHDEIDTYRLQITANDRLSVMHTRIYDHWRPQVGPAVAYQLALLAWSNEAGYQTLKRSAGV